MTTENFYIVAPNNFGDLISFNDKSKKFSKCCVKCGEAIKQSVESRLAQEVKNAGGMYRIYEFYVPTNIIDDKRQSGFDHILFGHQNIEISYNETIWKFCPNLPKKVPTSKEFGKEYLDIAPCINTWLKADKNYVNDIIKDIVHQKINNRKNIKILYLLEQLFKDHFDEVVDKYVNSKNCSIKTTKILKLFDHQHKIETWLMENINKGKRNIVTQLPPRFGKTLTFLKLFSEDKIRKLLIVAAYTGNVGYSYFKEIRLYDDFKDIQIINADEDLDAWRYDGKKAIILFPTTGSMNTINKRVSYINDLKSKMNINASEIAILNEEADYGDHTKNSNKKFIELMDTIDINRESLVIHTTGTEAWKATKLTAFGKFDAKVIVNRNDWNQLFA